MKRMTMIASLWMLCSAMVFSSCTNGKKADTPQENQPAAEAPATPAPTEAPTPTEQSVAVATNIEETQANGNPLNDKNVTQLVKYKDQSRNCVYYVNSSNKMILRKYDLDTEIITSIHLEEDKIKYANGESPFVYGVDQFGVHGDYIFIVANNGGSSQLFVQYLIAYNTLNGTFSEIVFGDRVRLLKGNRQAKVTRNELIKEGACMAENEYATQTKIINLP